MVLGQARSRGHVSRARLILQFPDGATAPKLSFGVRTTASRSHHFALDDLHDRSLAQPEIAADQPLGQPASGSVGSDKEPLGSPASCTSMQAHTSAEQILRRQLTAFAQFTTRSLGERNIDALMLDACLRARAGLGMTHAKLLEYVTERDRLLLRSGVGWKEGYVGQYEITTEVNTPIGHAFVLSEPVAVSDYSSQTIYCPARRHG